MKVHEHVKLTECAALEDISTTLSSSWGGCIDWFCRAESEHVLLC